MKKIGTKEERQEIKRLIKEADKMGFKKGVFYTVEHDDNIYHEEVAAHRAEHFHTYEDKRGITLFCGPSQGLIYSEGKFIANIDKKKSKKYW